MCQNFFWKSNIERKHYCCYIKKTSTKAFSATKKRRPTVPQSSIHIVYKFAQHTFRCCSEAIACTYLWFHNAWSVPLPLPNSRKVGWWSIIEILLYNKVLFTFKRHLRYFSSLKKDFETLMVTDLRSWK